LGFCSVLLRTELILLCGLSFLILVWDRLAKDRATKTDEPLKAVVSCSHLLWGGLLALAYIRIKMHFLLPDTALAKSSGEPAWGVTLYVTSKVFVGALSFGAGMFLFWLLTLLLLLRSHRFSMPVFLANSVFPILLFLAALRGQQIQGARYFAWTLCFSILWNILEIGRSPSPQKENRPGQAMTYGFLALLLLALPYEARALYPMLRSRATLLQQFESEDFKHFESKRGVAVDIGYIGYFSQSDMCDLAGLVNGREKARETSEERMTGCVATRPDFFFLDAATINDLHSLVNFRDWQVCSSYDFRNVNSSNRHYLIVPRAKASEFCSEVAHSVPSEIQDIAH
jgi:hypothetical protein